MNKYLVFTDLDGTFLNHEDYAYTDALPAVAALQQQDIPIIFTSSKTQAELQQLSDELGFTYPMIYETGCGVYWPKGYFPHLEGVCHSFCTDYERVIDILNQLRQQHGFQFNGFHDMTTAQVALATGLSDSDAARARLRQYGEPLQWQDSDEQLEQFRTQLQLADLHLVTGGRFVHVMSPVDKSHAIHWLARQYQIMQPDADWQTIGLGDSPNDAQLLATVDQPYLVRNLHLQAEQQELRKINGILPTKESGAAGWNEAIMRFLSNHHGA